MKTTAEFESWRVTTRINKAGNLALEIELNGEMHAEVILQEKGIMDVGGRLKPWPLGDKGWDMPGASLPTPKRAATVGAGRLPERRPWSVPTLRPGLVSLASSYDSC